MTEKRFYPTAGDATGAEDEDTGGVTYLIEVGPFVYRARAHDDSPEQLFLQARRSKSRAELAGGRKPRSGAQQWGPIPEGDAGVEEAVTHILRRRGFREVYLMRAGGYEPLQRRPAR